MSYSLRTRLLWLLFIATSLAALAQAVIAYQTALHEADEIFDYQMEQMALGLRGELQPSHSNRAATEESLEESFDFVIQIWSADGMRLYQSRERGSLPRQAELGFSDIKVGDAHWRAFALKTPTQIVQVAQDMAARTELASSLALRTTWPTLLLAPLLMLAIWVVVTRSLRPVDEAKNLVSARAANDLSEIPLSGLPSEVLPLVEEINSLFARVREAFEIQRHFVADAAHELRSPLTALRLQVQAIKRAQDDATRGIAADRLLQGIDRATRLVEQLLVLAREESADPQKLHMQELDVTEVARQAVADRVAIADARRIDISLDAPERITVKGNLEALLVLLHNLIDNAIKYNPPEGKVEVSVRRDSRAVSIAVDDSGPGIPPEDRARVFDRFYRVPGESHTGSGLGLAIVKTIVERHGGTLTLESSRLGGVRMTVRIPSA